MLNGYAAGPDARSRDECWTCCCGRPKLCGGGVGAGPDFGKTFRSLVLGPLPPAEIPARRPGVCRLTGGMCADFSGCACLLVRDVLYLPSVEMAQVELKIV